MPIRMHGLSTPTCEVALGLLKVEEPSGPFDFRSEHDRSTYVVLSQEHPLAIDIYGKSKNRRAPYCRTMEIPEHWMIDNTYGEPWERKEAKKLDCRPNYPCYISRGFFPRKLFNEQGKQVMTIPESDGYELNSALRRYWHALDTVKDTISSGMEN